MSDIATSEPLSFRAGDLVQWKKSIADYPASSYSLKYYLVKSSKQIVITATADGDDYLISIPAATSAAYEAGRYFYQARIELGAEVHTVKEGVIEILPNLATQSTGYEWREHAEQILENIEAVLLNKATADNLSYTVAGRSLSKYSWAELQDMRTHYQAELLKFNRKYGLTRPSRIEVQF